MSDNLIDYDIDIKRLKQRGYIKCNIDNKNVIFVTANDSEVDPYINEYVAVNNYYGDTCYVVTNRHSNSKVFIGMEVWKISKYLGWFDYVLYIKNRVNKVIDKYNPRCIMINSENTVVDLPNKNGPRVLCKFKKLSDIAETFVYNYCRKPTRWFDNDKIIKEVIIELINKRDVSIHNIAELTRFTSRVDRESIPILSSEHIDVEIQDNKEYIDCIFKTKSTTNKKDIEEHREKLINFALDNLQKRYIKKIDPKFYEVGKIVLTSDKRIIITFQMKTKLLNIVDKMSK